MIDGKVSAVAAQVGGSCRDEALGGDALVSSTAKGLVAGSGISFEIEYERVE